MNHLLKRLFIVNWPRKLVALFTAIFVWFLVNQTITVTRTIQDVPIRMINIPDDMTVVGLMPSGLLNRRVAVTVTGRKSTIRDLHPTDLEVVINADGKKESWIATIDRRNLVSLNQELDLKKAITEVTANDLYIRLSKLITEEIQITVIRPIGDPPKRFQFLDVWPKKLVQRVTGPEEQVKALKERGLELIFNLNRVTKSELETLYNRQGMREEISYKVPESWKKVAIPFRENALEEINDPRADLLRIDFLKQERIPLATELPITIFFPLKYSATINPQTYSFQTNDIVQKKNGLKRLVLPLYAEDVSRLFIDVVRDNLLLVVVAAPKQERSELQWAFEFIDESALEDAFVEASLKQSEELFADSERAIRYRFRDYLRNLQVYTEDGEPLELHVELDADSVSITQKEA